MEKTAEEELARVAQKLGTRAPAFRRTASITDNGPGTGTAAEPPNAPPATHPNETVIDDDAASASASTSRTGTGTAASTARHGAKFARGTGGDRHGDGDARRNEEQLAGARAGDSEAEAEGAMRVESVRNVQATGTKSTLDDLLRTISVLERDEALERGATSSSALPSAASSTRAASLRAPDVT